MFRDRQADGVHAPSPLDARAGGVAERLHEQSRRQVRRVIPSLWVKAAGSRLRNRTWDLSQSADGKAFLADKMVALDPHKAQLCYLLARSLNATRVVEIGTSYGVSTLYLASAVRDNLAAGAGAGAGVGTATGGVVIGTEHEPAKVKAARAHIEEAGLTAFTDIREGDLRETLSDLDQAGPVDFVLVDIWIPMALPALELLTPHLRSGAMVLCDNVVSAHTRYADYLDHVRAPNGPFTSVTVPGHGGVELSLKV